MHLIFISIYAFLTLIFVLAILSFRNERTPIAIVIFTVIAYVSGIVMNSVVYTIWSEQWTISAFIAISFLALGGWLKDWFTKS
ncbi:hypothetical protein LCGC14_2166120 [marine sediment metagenome]|uniref:Uncharacterized protein n=1 Tax=marine sediment metagenome TaxID=412755 RepID=A0A0F9GMI9_9ZZZZ